MTIARIEGMGPHEKRLVCRVASTLAVPDGGNFADGVNALLNLKTLMPEAVQQTDEIIRAVMATSDNPYGDDREAISERILSDIPNNR